MWNKTVTYLPGDQVTYDEILYECLIENTNELPTNTTYWILIWEDDVEYEIGERVKYIDDEEYVLIELCEVGTLPTDETYWRRLNSLIITGNEDIEYDLEKIAQMKDRLSEGELILPEEHSDKTKGQIMTRDVQKNKLSVNIEDNFDWNDPFNPRKR